MSMMKLMKLIKLRGQMAIKTISAYKARINFGQLIDDVRYNKTPYVVEKNGRPAVVIIDVADFGKIQKKPNGLLGYIPIKKY